MKISGLFKVFAFTFFLAVSFSVAAENQVYKLKIPCSQLKAQPYYADYGVSTPLASSGWKCTALVDAKTKISNKAFIWEKKGKSPIVIAGVPMEFVHPDAKEMKAWIDDPKEPEPRLSIRNFINAFSADNKYAINDSREALINTYIGQPKAVFFSRGNAIVMVYYNDTPKFVDSTKPVPLKDQKQRVLLFQNSPGHADWFLVAKCDGCLFDDLFNLVVNPVLQSTKF
jgi:hypothetical protein